MAKIAVPVLEWGAGDLADLVAGSFRGKGELSPAAAPSVSAKTVVMQRPSFPEADVAPSLEVREHGGGTVVLSAPDLAAPGPKPAPTRNERDAADFEKWMS